MSTLTDARPFSVEHFRRWASLLVLDNEQPWELEPFQEHFIADVFSGKTASWLVVPEGNGKTTLIAGLALYHAQHRLSASCPVAASSREQAKIMFDQAAGFVFRSELDHTFICQEGNRRIKCPSMGSEIKIFAADANTADGVIPTMAFVDELHRHKNLGLYRTWLGKMRKRDGQIIVISTAGEPGGEFETARESMRTTGSVEHIGALVRAVTPTSVLHDWALREGQAEDDLEAVAAANPFSGVTAESLAQKIALPGMTPQHWSRFTCNLPTRVTSAAIQEREWHDAATAEQIPDGALVWVGLDVGWQWDTTAIVPLWWKSDGERILGPAQVLEPPRDGSQLDVNLIKRALTELARQFLLEAVVMDSSRAEDVAAWIQDELGVQVVYRAQTSKPQGEDTERFMQALRSGALRHSGDAALRRHALNAVARLLPDGGWKFSRPASSRHGGSQDSRVIDALVAAAMVHSVRSEPAGAAWVGW